VLAQNARLRAGEADLIVARAVTKKPGAAASASAPDEREGLVVEVKATAGPYGPLARVDARKRARLLAIAEEAAARYQLSAVAVVVAAVHLQPQHEQITLHELDAW
jgi:Holliday junction resolvase-like predicted endonuclease